MKLILAFIRPSRIETVKAALAEAGVFRMTLLDCQGFGREANRTKLYRERERSANLLRKVQLQIAVNDEYVEPAINAIIDGGRTDKKGQIGDAKIFLLPLDECIRIRDCQRGDEAI